LLMHIDDSLLDGNKKIDQRKINHVARLGGDWYCQVNEQSLFQVEKPNTELGIGIDALPDTIRNSNIFSGNDLGRLANAQELPVIDPAFDDDHLKQIIQYYNLNPAEMEKELHLYGKKLLAEGKIKEAWQVLLAV
ncbi:MAG: flavin reductase family protein, partial [Chitinophagaceae bacterium]